MTQQQAPKTREEVIRQDVHDLHRLGYAQELFRTMGGFSNFAISFTIISILTGAVILFDYGLAWGGPAASTLVWPLVSVFTLLVAAAMAEIASAYPTAGGLYYWSSRMKNKDWGWWTAWFNLAGQIAIVAGIDFAAASFVNTSIVTPILSNFGITFGNSTAVAGSLINGQLLTMAILLAIQLFFNIAGVRIVSLLNDISVWWHIGTVAVIVLALFLITNGKAHADISPFTIQSLDTTGSASPLGFNLGAAAGYAVPIAFLFSLLQAQWTYTGYDASAHVAEETVGARLSSAWGVFISVAVSAVVGYIVLMGLVTHLPPLDQVMNCSPATQSLCSAYYGGNPVVFTTLSYNLGSLGDVLGAAIAIAMSLCGLASVAAAGRMLFAFSRDHGVPGSRVLRRVSHRFRTPANALVAIVVFSYLLTNAAYIAGSYTAIAIVTAISTIALYWAYGVPIFLGVFGKQEWRDHAVWKLGRFSKPIAVVAVLWIAFISVLFLWPTSGNAYTLLAYVVFLAALVVYYFAWARRHFKGPIVEVGEEELTEIEREFEHAAEELGGATV
ncbi:MAG: amino acid permease [Candidatus Limnocylindrales bacterium]